MDRIQCEPTIINDPQPVYRELPEQLTDRIPYPPGLPVNFSNRDQLDLIFSLYDALDLANIDRACAGQIVSGGDTTCLVLP